MIRATLRQLLVLLDGVPIDRLDPFDQLHLERLRARSEALRDDIERFLTLNPPKEPQHT